MIHPKQQDCAHQITHLARTGHFRVVNLNGNCHYFASEGGADILRKYYQIESAVPEGHLKDLFAGYELGSTNYHIPRENLTAVVGKFGISDALNGVASYIPKSQPAQGEGRA